MDTDGTRVSAGTTTHPTECGTNLPLLPGRTVTDGEATGVVTAAHGTDVVTVRWEGTFTQRCAVTELRTVNPDRPTLAHDDLFAVTLGEILARRSGPNVLKGFRQGYNNGFVSFKETARDALRHLDEVAAEAGRAKCCYTYVVRPDGARRTEGFEDGDRLIVCTFHVDGPNTLHCGPHRAMVLAGDRGSIYTPTPPDLDVPDDCRAIRASESLTPFEQPKALVAVAA